MGSVHTCAMEIVKQFFQLWVPVLAYPSLSPSSSLHSSEEVQLCKGKLLAIKQVADNICLKAGQKLGRQPKH